jgi:sigma-B regulation protein RsbU (phosphoserine phosphatase)
VKAEKPVGRSTSSRTRATAVTGLDRQVLQTLALEGATVIENAKLFRITREQERIQHDLTLARNIQQGLLPPKLPDAGYFELQAVTMASRTVGGDYYDVITLPSERYGLAVADVSGKGLPAAMMAVLLQGAFAAVAAGSPDLEELFRRVNDFLCERTPVEMFATVFYGVLNRNGRFSFVSAGHPPSLILRANGNIERLDSPNFPLGLFAGAPFGVDSARLEPGDILVIYSDGVTESQNSHNELFGEARLTALLEGRAGQRARDISAAIISGINDFVGGAPQADDLTLIVVRFGPP